MIEHQAEAIVGAVDSIGDALTTIRKGEMVNVTDALFAIADGLDSVAKSIHALGNADAATPMGAIEGFAAHIGERMESLTMAIGEIADAISSGPE